MADFPDSIYSPRTKENKIGVIYDDTQSTIPFAEDIVFLDDEVVAIENELGAVPKGSHASVGARFDDDESILLEHSARHEIGGDDFVDVHKTNEFNSGYSASQYDLVFMGSGGKWLEVDSDALATCNGLLGLALEAKNNNEAMFVALPGSFIENENWTWTVGAILYAGETLGAMQEAKPTGADCVIRPVAVAVSATKIYFNPSLHVQIAVA